MHGPWVGGERHWRPHRLGPRCTSERDVLMRRLRTARVWSFRSSHPTEVPLAQPAARSRPPAMTSSAWAADLRASRSHSRTSFMSRRVLSWRCDSNARAAARTKAVVSRWTAHAWMWAIATARQVCWAADYEQAQSRVAWARAVPRDRCDLDHQVVAWPGVAVISSLPAHALLPIVEAVAQTIEIPTALMMVGERRQ
jgi:hypothetical protein